MIFGVIALFALAVLTPLLLVLRGRTYARGARDPAMDLHRTQLRELDRDLAEGRLLPTEHKTAVLEVQRRLLAAAGQSEGAMHAGPRWPVIVTALVVPVVAVGLYMGSGSQPYLPSVDKTSPGARAAEEAALLDALRQQLSTMDPESDRTRQGYVLLGSAEEKRGNDAGAAAAYRMALRGKFNATVAALTAEATVRAEGGVSESSAALYRRALAAAPADAPWRSAVEQRLKEKRLP